MLNDVHEPLKLFSVDQDIGSSILSYMTKSVSSYAKDDEAMPTVRKIYRRFQDARNLSNPISQILSVKTVLDADFHCSAARKSLETFGRGLGTLLKLEVGIQL